MRKPAWKGSVEGKLFRHYPVEGRRMVNGGDILSFSGGNRIWGNQALFSLKESFQVPI